MSEEYVTLAEVRDLLSAEKERRGEGGFNQIQNSALTHSLSIKISAEDARAIVAEASALEQITEPVAVKIADILPKYPSEVRAILQKERISVDEDLVNSILEIVAKYQ